MSLTLIILFLVLFLITFQQMLPLFIPVWFIMLVGAVANVVLRQISLSGALQSINWDVMGFLLGVFILAQFLEQVNITRSLTDAILKKHYSPSILLFGVIVFSALGSMLLMNDAIAIIGVPVCLRLAQVLKMKAVPWLFALAFSVTIGSVMSPIGNPQNLLIAVSGPFHSPFVQFLEAFALPSFICLCLLFLFVRLRFGDGWCYESEIHIDASRNEGVDRRDRTIAVVSFSFLLLGVVLKAVMMHYLPNLSIPFCIIACGAGLPIVLFSSRRWKVIQQLDWGTLVFFLALFIVMNAAWKSPFVQQWALHLPSSVTSVSGIVVVSSVLSQFISNVPAAALYLPVIAHWGGQLSDYLALVCGSTISGMLTLVGAASNVIILQNVQKRQQEGFTPLKFMLVGFPFGCVALLVYSVFLLL